MRRKQQEKPIDCKKTDCMTRSARETAKGVNVGNERSKQVKNFP